MKKRKYTKRSGFWDNDIVPVAAKAQATEDDKLKAVLARQIVGFAQLKSVSTAEKIQYISETLQLYKEA
jgi:hypothetical protein